MKNGVLNLIIIVLLVLIGGAAVWLFYQKQPPAPTSETVIKNATAAASKASVLSSKSMALKKELTKTDEVIGDLILEKNSDFTIDYLIHNDQFMVFINKAPFSSAKTKAESWFKDKGFSTSDLCLLRISFTAKEEVKVVLSKTDVVSTGCST